MTHPDIERLRNLVTPPQQPVVVDLDVFEREVGAPLPTDFEQLMGIYGPGGVDDFLSVLAPDPAKRENMFESTAMEHYVHQLLARDDPDFVLAHPIYPDDGGLLKWGEQGNGHRLWWLTQGDPDEWLVLIQEAEGEDFFTYEGTATGLICDQIERKLDVWFIPMEEPWTEHKFDPLANPDAR